MKNTMLPGFFILLLLTGCLKEDPLKKPFTDFVPENIGDGWALSDPASEAMDAAALEALYQEIYDDGDLWMMKSLLVFRNGKLVAESYLKDESDRTEQAPIWSCTKQVTGIVTGFAIAQGYIGSVNDSIGKYLPDYIASHPDKKGITLKELLTMRSGVAFDNATHSDVFRQHKTENSIEYVLGLKLNHSPGTYFDYNDGDPQLISGIIQSATGKTLDEFGKEVLFDPLNVTNYRWERYSDGVTLGAFGILTSPRELAKIAECVLDSGRWDNRQIIPAGWWQEMLSAQVPNAHGDAAFGYYWWSILAKGWYFMWGHGGQFAFAMPSKQLLVVMTSLPQVEDDFALWYDKAVEIADKVASTVQQ